MQSKNILKSLYLLFLFMIALLGLISGLYSVIFWNAILIIIYTAKFGPHKTFLGVLFLCILSLVFKDIIAGAIVFGYAIPALLIGIFIFYKGKFSAMLISATLSQALIFMLHTLYLAKKMQKTPSELLFKDSFKEFINLISSTGQFESADVTRFETILSFLSDTLQGMLPCIYILVSVMLVYLLFMICRFLLDKTGFQIDFMPYFHEFWIPKEVSFIFVLLFLVSFFNESMILTNVTYIMFTVHVVCGIAFIDSFLYNKGIHAFFRFIILFLLFSFSSLVGGLVSSVLCCMGMSKRERIESR